MKMGKHPSRALTAALIASAGTALKAAVMAALLAAVAPTQAQAGAIVVNAQTGDVLFADDADRGHYPASLTKMMTLYMTFDALDHGRLSLGQQLPISAAAAGQVPSKLGLRRGETISVEQAILALVTKSANDAAVVLAEAMGGSEKNFAVAMTMAARDIGLYRTTFRNASGLHDRYQHTTPRDMANLAIALIRDFPLYYPYFSTTSFTYQGKSYANHNNLLAAYQGADGLKTGYVRAAGFNLAASVVRDQTRLVGVVLGGDTAAERDRDMADLFDTAFMRLHIIGPPVPAPAQVPATTSDHAALTAPRAPGLGPADPAMADIQVAELEGGPPAWAVQVGAYRGYDGAQKRIQEAAMALPLEYLHARPEIEPNSDTRLYLARLTGLTQVQASDACRFLEPAGIPCMVVAPQADGLDRADAMADVLRMLLPLGPAPVAEGGL